MSPQNLTSERYISSITKRILNVRGFTTNGGRNQEGMTFSNVSESLFPVFGNGSCAVTVLSRVIALLIVPERGSFNDSLRVGVLLHLWWDILPLLPFLTALEFAPLSEKSSSSMFVLLLKLKSVSMDVEPVLPGCSPNCLFIAFSIVSARDMDEKSSMLSCFAVFSVEVPDCCSLFHENDSAKGDRGTCLLVGEIDDGDVCELELLRPEGICGMLGDMGEDTVDDTALEALDILGEFTAELVWLEKFEG